MSYADDHAGASADILAAGTSVSFAKVHAGTATFTTGRRSNGSTVTVTGSAIRVKGNPLRYAQLSITQSDATTLLFCPTTYGELPELGASVVWDGTEMTVRDVSPIAPDGTAIIARVICTGGGRSHTAESVAA